LEVGTGFHPELTGRENIYLNGAILGMRKAEIERKFDEIVDFAEIEKFIDTPVKHYSSGMYVRLAFAVAAHLEPEILLVDEVLAVGDAAFQKKCLGKMGDVAREGRTVLFVSHNMVAVQSLCDRVIWIREGTLAEDGPTNQVVSSYLKTSFSNLTTQQQWDDIDTAPGNREARLHRACVRPENGTPTDLIMMESPFLIEVEYWNLLPQANIGVTLHVYTEEGVVAISTSSIHDKRWRDRNLTTGLFRSICHFPGILLNSGIYRILLLFVKDVSSVIYRHEDILSFEIVESETSPRAKGWFGKREGIIRPLLEWSTEQIKVGNS
jgi:lipopolysaccharide transport system ATP-binding protein